MLSVVRNTALTCMQTNRRPAQVSLDAELGDTGRFVDTLVVCGESGGDPAAIQLRRSEVEALNRAIRSLPLNQRDVVLLRDVEGLSSREIAAILEVPAGTVMSRLSRTRDALEARLRTSPEAFHGA